MLKRYSVCAWKAKGTRVNYEVSNVTALNFTAVKYVIMRMDLTTRLSNLGKRYWRVKVVFGHSARI